MLFAFDSNDVCFGVFQLGSTGVLSEILTHRDWTVSANCPDASRSSGYPRHAFYLPDRTKLAGLDRKTIP